MLDFLMPAPLQEIEEAHDVAVDIGLGVGQGVPHAGLGGQVHDPLNGLARKQSGHGCAVGQIQLEESEPLEGRELSQPCFLEAHVIIVIEVIKAQDDLAALQEPSGDMVADEAGRAGYKDH